MELLESGSILVILTERCLLVQAIAMDVLFCELFLGWNMQVLLVTIYCRITAKFIPHRTCGSDKWKKSSECEGQKSHRSQKPANTVLWVKNMDVRFSDWKTSFGLKEMGRV